MTFSKGQLPEDWTVSTVGSLAQPNGIAYGVLKPGPPIDGGVPMLRVGDVKEGRVDHSSIYRISEQLDHEYRRTRLRGGEVVVSIQGSVGRVAVIPPDLAGANVSRTLAMIRLRDPRLARWVHRALESPQAQQAMRALVGGTTRDSLNLRDLRQIEIPVAPEPERGRLLRLLELVNHLSQSSSLHLASTRRAIESFRQSVLVAACSGKLTADWRALRVDPVDVESLLNVIDTKRERPCREYAADWVVDLPASWALVSLDRLTTFITSGSRGWAKYYAADGPLFIRSQDINSDRLDLSEVAHVRPPRGSEGERTKALPGDLLVTITGANVTKSAWINRDLPEAYVNQHVALARPVLPAMAEYVHIWTISPGFGRRKLLSDAYGAGRPGLNLENLRTMPVGLPPAKEQAEIVRRVDQLLEVASRLDRQVEVAEEKVRCTLGATLAKAFRGALTPAANGG